LASSRSARLCSFSGERVAICWEISDTGLLLEWERVISSGMGWKCRADAGVRRSAGQAVAVRLPWSLGDESNQVLRVP
jgi:hypothetical protein